MKQVQASYPDRLEADAFPLHVCRAEATLVADLDGGAKTRPAALRRGFGAFTPSQSDI